MSPGLDGTGRVADDLWLLAHNDVTGRPFVQPRPLGLGLAGALLAELVLAGALGVAHDHLTPAARRRPPADELAGRVLAKVAAERDDHPVRDWLAYLARTAAADVAHRLAASGYLARAARWPWWRPGRWRPVDRDSAFAPVLRVRVVLDAARPPAAESVVLAGLAEASGLGFRLAQYAPNRRSRPLGQAIAGLDPALATLIAQTRSAVASAVLSHRVLSGPPHTPRQGAPSCPEPVPPASPVPWPARWRGTGWASRPCCSSSWPGSRR